MQQNIVQDRLIISPINNVWSPSDLEGNSFYNQICNTVRRNIEEEGDWLVLHDRLTNEKMMASEFEPLAKKFAVIFGNLGLGKDDVIHLVVGNNNYTVPACGGIWILGGIVSLGDVALDSISIAGQVRTFFQSWSERVVRAIVSTSYRITFFSRLCSKICINTKYEIWGVS